MPQRPTADRPARIREALCTLVAGRGFQAASMAEVASRAGVATGTAYVHYTSKDALILATYREIRLDLGFAALAGVPASLPPGARFEAIWQNIHRHLRTRRDRAKFLLQVEAGPWNRSGDGPASTDVPEESSDPLATAMAAPDMVDALVDLPVVLVFDLGLGPAVRLAAGATELSDADLSVVSRACWRAVRRPLRAGAFRAT